jgi:release factor glutamine methyltransferase
MTGNRPKDGFPFVETGDVSVSIVDWLRHSADRLSSARTDADLSAAMSDLRVLAQKKLGIPKTTILAHPEMQLNKEQLSLLAAGLAGLIDGQVLPYVLGEWEFFGRLFTVTPDVLIPRPETELLVETALTWMKGKSAARIADVGTGSGCIAVSLALEHPGACITAVDISHSALQVARSNINRYSLQRKVSLVQADLLSIFSSGSFELICANLPYIPSGRLPDLEVSRSEPRLALDGGPEGLDLLGRLINDCGRLLTQGGLALLEIDDTHTDGVLALTERSFNGTAQVMKDYQGKPRLLKLDKNPG